MAPKGTLLHTCANTPAHNHAHKDTILHRKQSVSLLTVLLGPSYGEFTKTHIPLLLFEFPSEPEWSPVSVLGWTWVLDSWLVSPHTSLFIIFPSGHGRTMPVFSLCWIFSV